MDQNEPRGQVIRRLRRRRDFVGMLVAYVVVNLFLVGVWVFTSHDGDFWPIWPISLRKSVWKVAFGSAARRA